jgi:DNA polymerase elongation subunit (family B)
MLLQPCDWIERDVGKKYCLDVYGRTEDREVAMVRIQGFRPYLYVSCSLTISEFRRALAKEQLLGLGITEVKKFDIYDGFTGFADKTVWKVETDSLFDFRNLVRHARRLCTATYEGGLPPFLRVFHEQELAPASPLRFHPSGVLKPDNETIQKAWTVDIRDIRSAPTVSIPLKIAAYDIECFSGTGNFPIAQKEWKDILRRLLEDAAEAPEEKSLSDIWSERLDKEGFQITAKFKSTILLPFLRREDVQDAMDANDIDTLSRMWKCSTIGDPIIQIGMTCRWSTDMLKTISRKIFILGTCDAHSDFVSCDTEAEVLQQFAEYIAEENPDVICGYNTYGFDDRYLIHRADLYGLNLQFGRKSVPMKDCLDHKTFELASGKYDVNFIKTPGRLTIDLLLNMRREHNLDSYTLDNVASTFLRDKVTGVEEVDAGTWIQTKTTRGLFAGNYVRFDLVGNTIDPFRDGEKFSVLRVEPKRFLVEAWQLFDSTDSLEWSFTKDDLHPRDIFRLQKGTAADRSLIARYCLQDCELVLTLMAKLDTLVNARGMADVCMVPLQYLFLRGQGIKIFSRVAYEAARRNQIIVEQPSLEGQNTTYEGAIVISPQIGMYLDTPIAVLDFNSLYPSSMIGENLSPDTLVCMKIYNTKGSIIAYEGLPAERIAAYRKEGWRFNEVSYDNKENGAVIGKTTCLFIEPREDAALSVGIIPQTLDIMLKMRKETRLRAEFKTVSLADGRELQGFVSTDGDLTQIKNPLTKTSEKVPTADVVSIVDTYEDAQKAVFNGLQLAYKVVANSIYGQMGSATSPIRKLCVAACTTAVGRRQLLFAKSTVESEFGAEVVYGDSVAKYTPVLVRIHGNINIIRVDQLDAYGTGWMTYGVKELCQLSGVETWTEKGWTRVQNIVRHAAAKKMVRVITHSGIVDVTEDHSLVRKDGSPASSADVSIGDELLHAAYPEQTHECFETSVEEARIAGFFFGSGHCSRESWSIPYSVEYLELCKSVYPHVAWVCKENKLYSLSDTTFNAAYYASMYTSFGEKRIPMSILNGSHEVREAFKQGLAESDFDDSRASQLTLAHVRFIQDSTMVCNIVSITELPDYEGYVYDLTTENHHFQAGVGRMIVHNTDSIFIKFPRKNLVESITSGQEAAEMITSRCKKAFVIGYEKTFYPFILFCRKRYVGMMYEEDPTKCKRKSMGIVLKRRDNAPIVKDVFGGALDILLLERNIQKASQYVKDMLMRVLRNEVALEKYIISKSLRDDYKDPTKIAHRVLADRMGARDPGNKPNVGDRLPFIYIHAPDKKLQGDKIEHVQYVKDRGLKVDTLFYITNQIQNPVAQLFALCISQLEGYREPSVSYARMLEGYMAENGGDLEDATLKVLAKKERHLESLLFLEAPYLQKHIRASRSGPLDNFFKKK